MARGAPIVFRRFDGGLNTNSAPYELSPIESPDLLNVRSDTTRGAVTKREGMLDIGDPAGVDFAVEPRRVAVLRAAGSATLVAIGGDAASTTFQPMDPLSAPGPVHVHTSAIPRVPQRWDWVMGPKTASEPMLYFMCDDQHVTYDGSAWGTFTAPNGSVLCVYNNRLFVGRLAGGAEPESTYSWSDPGDFDNFPINNTNALEPYGGSGITAMVTLGQWMLVFKRDGIWKVYDDETGANVRITDEAGTVFRDSVVSTDKGCYFLDQDRGVMMTNGEKVQVVSDAILPDLETVRSDGDLSYNVTAAYWSGSYWLSIADATGMPFRLLELDLDSATWWRHDCGAWDLQVAAFPLSGDSRLSRDSLIAAVPSARLEALGVAPADSAPKRLMQLMREGATADRVMPHDPAPIAFRWLSGPILVDDDPHLAKRLAELRVDTSGVCDVLQIRNFSASDEGLGAAGAATAVDPSSWGGPSDGTWGAPSPYFWGGPGHRILQSRFHTLGVARAVQFLFRGAHVAPFELHSYALFTGPRRRSD